MKNLPNPKFTRATYIRRSHPIERKPQRGLAPDSRAHRSIPPDIDPVELLDLIKAGRIHRETPKRRGPVGLENLSAAITYHKGSWAIRVSWMGSETNIAPTTLHRFTITNEDTP